MRFAQPEFLWLLAAPATGQVAPDSEAAFHTAVEHAAQGRYDEAADAYRQLVARDPAAAPPRLALQKSRPSTATPPGISTTCSTPARE